MKNLLLYFPTIGKAKNNFTFIITKELDAGRDKIKKKC
jgi:hypothetical protein